MVSRRDLILLGIFLFLDVVCPRIIFVNAGPRHWQLQPLGQRGVQSSPSLAPTSPPSSTRDHPKKTKRTKRKTAPTNPDEAHPKITNTSAKKKTKHSKKKNPVGKQAGTAFVPTSPKREVPEAHEKKKMKKRPSSSNGNKDSKDSSTAISRAKSHFVKKAKRKGDSMAVKSVRPYDLPGRKASTYNQRNRAVNDAERLRVPYSGSDNLSNPSREKRKKKSKKRIHPDSTKSSPKAQKLSTETTHSERKKKSTKKKRKTAKKRSTHDAVVHASGDHGDDIGKDPAKRDVDELGKLDKEVLRGLSDTARTTTVTLAVQDITTAEGLGDESLVEEAKDATQSIEAPGSFAAIGVTKSVEHIEDKVATVATLISPTTNTTILTEDTQGQRENITQDTIDRTPTTNEENVATIDLSDSEEGVTRAGTSSIDTKKSESSHDSPEQIIKEDKGEVTKGNEGDPVANDAPRIDNDKNIDDEQCEQYNSDPAIISSLEFPMERRVATYVSGETMVEDSHSTDDEKDKGTDDESDSAPPTIVSVDLPIEEGTKPDSSKETDEESLKSESENTSTLTSSVGQGSDSLMSVFQTDESRTLSVQDVVDVHSEHEELQELGDKEKKITAEANSAQAENSSPEVSEDPYLDLDVVHFVAQVLKEDVEEVLAWTDIETSTATDSDNVTTALNDTRGGSQVTNTGNLTRVSTKSDLILTDLVLHDGNSTVVQNELMDPLAERTDNTSVVEVEVEIEMEAKRDIPKSGSKKRSTPERKLLDRAFLETTEDKKTDATVSVVTWNLAEESPPEEDAEFIRAFRKLGVKTGTGSDLVLISAQECENIKPRRTEGRRSREYRRLMIKMLGKDYVPIALHLLGGIQFGLFAKKSFLKDIEHVSIADVTCGIGNVFHNKGAIAAFLQVKARNPPQDSESDTSRSKSLRMVFVTAHMAAHVKNSDARDADFWRISSELEAQAPEGFLPKQLKRSETDDRSLLFDSVDRAFFCGDLNYRLDLPREATEYAILKGDPEVAWLNLLTHDQLCRTMTEGRAFPGFAEGNIKFAPTFKFDKDSGDYDTSHKQRIPAWTDRILFKPWGTRVLSYQSVPGAQHSDHRPVHGTFRINMEGRELPPTKSKRKKQKKEKDSVE